MKSLMAASGAVLLLTLPAMAGVPTYTDLLHKAQYWTGSYAEEDTRLVDAAAHTGAFKTLIKAAEAAGLDQELQKSGPYTVFAPTDAAFAKMPPATLERLMAPENREELTALLELHVIPGEKLTTAELRGQELKAETLNGPLHIDASDPISGVRVNEAAVTLPDIEASNGVIHAIDSVLIPPR